MRGVILYLYYVGHIAAGVAEYREVYGGWSISKPATAPATAGAVSTLVVRVCVRRGMQRGRNCLISNNFSAPSYEMVNMLKSTHITANHLYYFVIMYTIISLNYAEDKEIWV